jgi:hypothetical protein
MGELGAALAEWLLDRGIKEDLAGNSLQAVWLKDKPRPLVAVGRRLRARVPHTSGHRLLFAALAVAGVVLTALALRRAPARAVADTPRVAGPAPTIPADSTAFAAPVAPREEPVTTAASPEPSLADARRAPGTVPKYRGKTPVRASSPASNSRRAPATKKSIRDFGI